MQLASWDADSIAVALQEWVLSAHLGWQAVWYQRHRVVKAKKNRTPSGAASDRYL